MIHIERSTDYALTESAGPVQLCRTADFDCVRRILTLPEIYPLIGDDFTPPVEEFEVNEHPDIWYLTVHDGGRLLGLFTLLPQNRVCWELHVVMTAYCVAREKWKAARMLPEWLAQNTGCKRLTAAVPACNGPAIVYGTHGIGMQYVGRQEKAFMKCGQLHDLVLLGRSIGGVPFLPSSHR